MKKILALIICVLMTMPAAANAIGMKGNNPVINYEDYFDCVDDEISKNVNIEKVNTISLYEEISGDPIDVEQSDTKVNIPKCVIDPDTEKYYNCSNLN